MLHPYCRFVIIRPVLGVWHHEPKKNEFITPRVVRVSECFANAIGIDGDMSLKDIPEIVEKSVRPNPHVEIAATCLAATLDAPNVNSDEIAAINEVHISAEKTTNNRAGSIEVAKSESNDALVRPDRCSFEDRLHSLQKELRDIRRLLEDTKSKVPNSVS
jgi:hypothetical protein